MPLLFPGSLGGSGLIQQVANGTGSKILLENGTDRILMEDGTSFLLTEA